MWSVFFSNPKISKRTKNKTFMWCSVWITMTKNIAAKQKMPLIFCCRCNNYFSIHISHFQPKPKKPIYKIKPIGGEKNGKERKVLIRKPKAYYPTKDKWVNILLGGWTKSGIILNLVILFGFANLFVSPKNLAQSSLDSIFGFCVWPGPLRNGPVEPSDSTLSTCNFPIGLSWDLDFFFFFQNGLS